MFIQCKKCYDEVTKHYEGYCPKCFVQNVIKQRTIACDLDGTLAEYDVWKGVDVIGAPKEDVVERLRKERSKGSKIVIHTTRTSKVSNPGYSIEELVFKVRKWLDENRVPYDEIWSSEGKPITDEYWDDRAVKI